jgi:hypothetical protein
MHLALSFLSMKSVISRLWKHKHLKLDCFIYYEQSDWSKSVKTIFIISLCIHDIGRLACNTKWRFFRSSTVAHIIINSKRELMRDENFKLFWLCNLSILSVPDEGYSRNASCTLNLIFTFLSNIKYVLYRNASILLIDTTYVI